MKNRKYFPALVFGLILLLIGGIGMYYVKTHYITAEFKRDAYIEIAGSLNRPECGWYQLYAYSLQPDTRLADDKLYVNVSDDDGYSYRLALIEFNLSAYADRKLDTMAMKNMERVFQNFATTSMKLIVRFLYDWDGHGKEKEPQEISYITQHMEQASGVLNEFKSLIYTTQGIFVGSWGEMHDSKFMSAEDLTTLLLTYAEHTDDSIYLAVRTPDHYHTILSELETHPEKYTKYSVTPETLKKRLGLFNDGLLGSASDLGTYPQVDAAAETEKEATRQKVLGEVGTIALQAPMGGEAVGEAPFSDGNQAVKDLSAMHISYLNQIYDTRTIEKWKQTPFADANLLYQGKTCYDYITDHLGARFVIEDCTFSYQPFQKGDASGHLFITNKGFSGLYTSKEFSLRMIHTETGQETTILDSSTLEEKEKPEHWTPGDTVKIPFSFSPFAFENGNYRLVAALKEPGSEELIPFANEGLDENDEGYLLGTIRIKHF